MTVPLRAVEIGNHLVGTGSGAIVLADMNGPMPGKRPYFHGVETVREQRGVTVAQHPPHSMLDLGRLIGFPGPTGSLVVIAVIGLLGPKFVLWAKKTRMVRERKIPTGLVILMLAALVVAAGMDWLPFS